MAGRRLLRDAVKTLRSSHKDFENIHVVTGVLSNAYSQRTSTYEEYQVQIYEVISTISFLCHVTFLIFLFSGSFHTMRPTHAKRIH